MGGKSRKSGGVSKKLIAAIKRGAYSDNQQKQPSSCGKKKKGGGTDGRPKGFGLLSEKDGGAED